MAVIWPTIFVPSRKANSSAAAGRAAASNIEKVSRGPRIQPPKSAGELRAGSHLDAIFAITTIDRLGCWCAKWCLSDGPVADGPRQPGPPGGSGLDPAAHWKAVRAVTSRFELAARSSLNWLELGVEYTFGRRIVWQAAPAQLRPNVPERRLWMTGTCPITGLTAS